VTEPAFAHISGLARDDMIVMTEVNGRQLRFVGFSVLEGDLPKVIWSDLLHVMRIGLFKRVQMTQTLRRNFRDQTEEISIGGWNEIAVPLRWAAMMLASSPNMPDGLAAELKRAADFAVARFGDAILSILPARGVA